MAKYLVIISHDVIQLCEFGFSFLLQPELLTDEVNPFLLFLGPFYLCLLKLLYHQVMTLSLSVNAWTASKTSRNYQ